ncbi:MAG: hypothetical protein M1822_000428 [Bathelium mastoideum]|nr:MAG: hypothetical protein M1822_000428 [Bathelium mastoideum]
MMLQSHCILSFWVLGFAGVQALTLQNVCTTSHVTASLPAGNFYPGIIIDPSSVKVGVVTNASVSNQDFFPDAIFDYCNVTFAYSHNGLDDQVLLNYWLPSPSEFKNRYLSTGGGGYAISSGSRSLPGGIIYGAVAGTTDGGFGSFSTNFDNVYPLVNGTPNYPALYSFGYKGHEELSALGKEFTRHFFNMSSSSKLYSYYQGCSEGGREGWSQVQRFADEWDGAITGAPAFRFSFQQVQHLYSNIVEKTLDYYPPSCELDKIVNETIAACDSLDGRTDGVVARSDLCKLQFNASSIIGKPYYCAASSGSTGMGPPGSSSGPTPAQNGTVTAKGIDVTNAIIDGLHDTKGRRVYLSYQPAASFADAATQYNSSTGTWELDVSTFGTEFVTRFLQLLNTSTSTLDNLNGVTYDTLKQWMIEGWQLYEDSLETTWPDLTPFHNAGGKVLHFHGESDNSIPTASSVRYYESVRSIMYPDQSYNESTAALNDWYRLFLVPGAAHCSPNTLQPNGPFPQTNLAVLIDWVENGVTPMTLNATVLQGQHEGEKQQICAWPLRPLWTNNGTAMQCEYDQASIDTWLYDFDAIKLPVY